LKRARKKLHAGNTLKSWISIWKMLPDISQPSGTHHGIAYGME
jgi:hypothetical protein